MEIKSSEEYLLYIDQKPESIFVVHDKVERRFPVHKHNKGQLTYVDGGIAYVHVEGKILVVPARHYLWIPPGLLHFLTIRSTAAAIRTLYFTIESDDEFYRRMGIYPVDNLLHEMLLFTERVNWEVDTTNKHHTLLKALLNLLPEISNNILHTVLPVTRNERLLPILRYLESHISEEISLAKISRTQHFFSSIS
jgi:hypothetical protein